MGRRKKNHMQSCPGGLGNVKVRMFNGEHTKVTRHEHSVLGRVGKRGREQALGNSMFFFSLFMLPHRMIHAWSVRRRSECPSLSFSFSCLPCQKVFSSSASFSRLPCHSAGKVLALRCQSFF